MRTIELNLNNWAKSELPLSAYIVLQLLINNDRSDVEEFCHACRVVGDTLPLLDNNKYLTIEGDKITATADALKLFKDSENVSTWIDDWRNLFPDGTSPHGYRWRANKAICIKKMKQWIAKHKHDKESIFKATSNYLKRLNGVYDYCQIASNFIFKDNVDNSNLLTEIENVNSEVKTDNIRERTLI